MLLLAPAIWNGYPLLQYDTGGYLARWYEGYLVPSRSTVFGLYLHFGEDSGFWINLGIQALATLWILQLTLRVFGMARPSRLVAISLVLILTTALPWLASMLLTDIFAGLSVLSLFILVLHGDKISTVEKLLLFVFTAFAGATHSATLAVLLGLCCAGWIARPLLGTRIAVAGLLQGSLTIVAGAAMLLAANFALSGQLAWTPGGYGVAFGRMMQDGIVARYLRDHCPEQQVEALPLSQRTAAHRRRLPVGPQHVRQARPLPGPERRDGLHRAAFAGRISGSGRPRPRIVATAQQLADVATGEGTTVWIPHTYGIIEHYMPAQLAPMRAARQQHRDIDFTVDQPDPRSGRAGLDAAGGRDLCGRASGAGGSTISTLLAATVSLALLGNAFVCGVISGPHDRYGARMVWIATLVALIAAFRHFADRRRRRAKIHFRA